MRLMAKITVPILTISLLAGCSSYEKKIDEIASKEESVFAKNYLEKLRKNNLSEVKEYLSSELLTPDIDSKLTELASYFPAGNPISVKLIGSNFFTSSDKWQANLSYQYQFDKDWALASIVLARENGKLIVKGIHVNRLDQPLEKTNAFTLSNKSIIHYLFLFFAVLVPIFIIYSLILCIKTPIIKRKWLWIIFILIGFLGVKLNWATGQIGFKLINIQLFGTKAVTASPYAPWIITISLPLGAIIFLLKRNSLMAKKKIKKKKSKVK